MGVIRKIVLSLLLVANLAHGQSSVDLNGGDLTAPLLHQGKIEQQYSPGNIKRTYGGAPGQNLAPLDENIETIYVSPEGRSNYRPNYHGRTGSQDPTTNLKNLRRSSGPTGLCRTDSENTEWKSLSFVGFLDGIFYVFQVIMMLVFGTFLAGGAFAVIAG